MSPSTKRRLAELAVFTLLVVAAIVYTSRTCTLVLLGMPTETGCDDGWVVPALVAIGVLMVLGEGFWTFVGYARSRPCPRCGHRVRRGVLTCGECGFDFRSIGAERPRGWAEGEP